MKAGLVSVTFRQLSPEAVIDLCCSSNLQAIEWGGDMHVPHGDLERARRVGEATRAAGLEVASYGSYYRGPESEEEGLGFARVLETARALGAPRIRVWAGKRGSAKADPAYRQQVAACLKAAGDLAAAHGLSVDLEYHANTLTDSVESTEALLRFVNHPSVRSLWQPSSHLSFEEQCASLEAIKPWLAYFHVYHWATVDGKLTRLPLADGAEPWADFLRRVTDLSVPYGLLEFVRDESPSQLKADAATLNCWLSGM